MFVMTQPKLPREEPNDMFSYEGERALFIFSGLYVAPDKISRKFVFGFKESRKLH